MMECGTTCLAMIFKYYGYYNIQPVLAELGEISTEGIDLYTISEIAEDFGFKTDAYRLGFDSLVDIGLPCVAHYEGNHFVVIYKVDKDDVWIADPAFGKDKVEKTAFRKKWNGIVLSIEPTKEIFSNKDLVEVVEESRQRHKTIFQRFYWSSILPYKGVLLEILLATFVLQLLGLAIPFFTQTIVDNVLVNQNKKLLFGILMGMLVVFAGQILLFYVRNMLLVQFKVRFEFDFFSKFFSHFISLPQKYYDNHHREELIARFRENLKIRELTNPAILQNVIDLFFIIGYLPLLLIYNWQLGLISIIFSFTYMLITILYTPKIRNLLNKIFYKDASVLGKFMDTLLGINSVKLLGIEKLKFWKWQGEYKRNLNTVLTSTKAQIHLMTFQKSLHYIAQMVIYWLGAYMTFQGALTLGQYLAFITIFTIILNALNNVSHLWLNLTQLSVTVARLNDVLVQQKEKAPLQNQFNLDTITQIRLENVHFKYNRQQEKNILDGMNLTIQKGEKIGIVGRNGAGKTTLVKLLVNLYPQYEGNIWLNQTEVRQINPRILRKKVFLFPQDIYVFNGTIRENIAYANPSAKMDAIIAAAKLATLHDFVKSLYLGYNHKIGEGGSNLSGGQKLKVGFARLFLSNPDVIILDEASSMLDLQTEQRILQNVQSHFGGLTIISIAHRLNTLRNSDRILVLDKGKVVEQGNHGQLMAQKGLYFDFLRAYVDY